MKYENFEILAVIWNFVLQKTLRPSFSRFPLMSSIWCNHLKAIVLFSLQSVIPLSCHLSSIHKGSALGTIHQFSKPFSWEQFEISIFWNSLSDGAWTLTVLLCPEVILLTRYKNWKPINSENFNGDRCSATTSFLYTTIERGCSECNSMLKSFENFLYPCWDFTARTKRILWLLS